MQSRGHVEVVQFIQVTVASESTARHVVAIASRNQVTVTSSTNPFAGQVGDLPPIENRQ